YDYSRLQNPTREEVERIVNDLEEGVDAIAFSTGMAALTVLLEMLAPGDNIVSTDDLYGGTIRLMENVLSKNGITTTFVETDNLKNVENALTEKTKMIYIETPTNPMMKVSDIHEISKIAKKNNCILVVDNTFLTPYFQKPLKLGADIVVHSGTKYLAGHNDTLAGFLVTNSPEISEKLRYLTKTIGAGLSPFDSWLVLRGIKTLHIRMEQHQKNAIKIAVWLKTQKAVKSVYYPGLEENESIEISKKQSTGFGGMVSFHVDSPERAKKILKNIKVIQFAESLGGVETLMTYPMYQTHADVPMEERLARGIDECLLRLSVGIEDVNDLIEDLNQAINN
ncbi:MAG: trans-sulfuration enzyme family protein, partial [Fusobacterium polymorphum]